MTSTVSALRFVSASASPASGNAPHDRSESLVWFRSTPPFQWLLPASYSLVQHPDGYAESD